MPQILWKIVYKVMRSSNSRKNLRIKSGQCEHLKWNVSVTDSRYLLGTYEPELAKIVEREVKEGKRFVDIGANAGYFTLLAARNNPEIAHLAIEPFPENVALLKEHLFINDFANTKVLQVAVSDEVGEVEFSDSGNLAANTYKTESTIFRGNKIKVKTTTLTELAKSNDLDAECFIKIDVEGAELDVLQGGIDYLQKFHPDIVLATHDNHVKGVKDKCLNLLEGIGYQITALEDIKIDGQEDFICTAAATK